ncbi:MAG: response regulator [Nitrososphaeraceae archaeon]|jgi:DNA-binding response OmpR family regulator|nr:response regulator [Nitrososphaeraceae archaeon]
MQEETSSIPSSSTLSTNTSAGSKRILLVDDEPDVTLTFKMGLEGKGYKVDAFNDPEEALAHFKIGAYDLLLLDIKMPKMNGFQLYEELEKLDKEPKVCFITAFEVYYRSLRELFPQIDIDCFIKKPIDTEELIKRIQVELQ